MRRWERRSYARRREIGDKCEREKLFVNLSHSTPAHQKKPKTRHFLVVLFRVSFNFSDIFTLYYPKSVKRYRSAMKQGFSVAERRKLFLSFLLQKKSPDRHRSLLLKVFWKIFLFYRHKELLLLSVNLPSSLNFLKEHHYKIFGFAFRLSWFPFCFFLSEFVLLSRFVFFRVPEAFPLRSRQLLPRRIFWESSAE